jgi:hypothetical protein
VCGQRILRLPPESETRAVCVSSARTDLCGGRPAMTVPTATLFSMTPFSPVDAPDGFFSTLPGGAKKDSTNSLPRTFDKVQDLGGCDSKQTSSQSSTVRS